MHEPSVKSLSETLGKGRHTTEAGMKVGCDIPGRYLCGHHHMSPLNSYGGRLDPEITAEGAIARSPPRPKSE